MLKSTQLDMKSVRASLQAENALLQKRGFALPYLENGEVKFEKVRLQVEQSKAKETA
jgi:hypothetical protein